MVTHPYSIYIWQPPLSPTGMGHWNEPIQAYTEQWAIYIAGLIHQDSHSVMKVVRYELNIACFPDEHAVELENDRLLNKRSGVIQRSIKSLCKFHFWEWHNCRHNNHCCDTITHAILSKSP